MTSSFSIYLDLVRFQAALLVYLFHIGYYSGARIPAIGNLGSESVLVFFVLSGFVIAYSSSKKHVAFKDFVIARLARLWSVMLPALVLTMLADSIGQYLNLAAYAPLQPYSTFKWLASSVINFAFLGQMWNLKISPGTNGPFWSIAYEFWFYALFAASIYFNGLQRIILCLACSFVAGPKIIMTYPIWYFGVVTYRKLSSVDNVPFTVGLSLWISSVLLGLLYFSLNGPQFLEEAFPALLDISKMQWRVNFLPESLLLAILIVVNLYGAWIISKSIHEIQKSIAVIIKLGADTSFGLYLFHYPIILLCKAVFLPLSDSYNSMYIIIMYTLPLTFSIYIALVCEKYKEIYKNCLNFIR
jgi:peptidoglycan/LPS O-acetylase OafA/YrhL